MTQKRKPAAIQAADELCESIPGYPEPTRLELAAADILRTQYAALQEWMDKTLWVEETLQFKELGMHYADIMRTRLDARDARIAELEAAGQWGGWMPLDQAPQGELMLFCDMKATELRASFFVDWMVNGKFCGNRHHTATHCMKLPPAPTGDASQFNDLDEKSAEDTPTLNPWYPDDSGEWVEVPEDLMEMPAIFAGDEVVEVVTQGERDLKRVIVVQRRINGWDWFRHPGAPERIVAYKVVKPTC